MDSFYLRDYLYFSCVLLIIFINLYIFSGTGVRWYNMYGAPEFKNEKILANIKKAGVELYNKSKQVH